MGSVFSDLPYYKGVRFLAAFACALVVQAQIPNYEKNFANAKRSYAQGRFQDAEWSMAAALAEVENASPTSTMPGCR